MDLYSQTRILEPGSCFYNMSHHLQDAIGKGEDNLSSICHSCWKNYFTSPVHRHQDNSIYFCGFHTFPLRPVKRIFQPRAFILDEIETGGHHCYWLKCKHIWTKPTQQCLFSLGCGIQSLEKEGENQVASQPSSVLPRTRNRSVVPIVFLLSIFIIFSFVKWLFYSHRNGSFSPTQVVQLWNIVDVHLFLLSFESSHENKQEMSWDTCGILLTVWNMEKCHLAARAFWPKFLIHPECCPAETETSSILWCDCHRILLY